MDLDDSDGEPPVKKPPGTKTLAKTTEKKTKSMPKKTESKPSKKNAKKQKKTKRSKRNKKAKEKKKKKGKKRAQSTSTSDTPGTSDNTDDDDSGDHDQDQATKRRAVSKKPAAANLGNVTNAASSSPERTTVPAKKKSRDGAQRKALVLHATCTLHVHNILCCPCCTCTCYMYTICCAISGYTRRCALALHMHYLSCCLVAHMCTLALHVHSMLCCLAGYTCAVTLALHVCRGSHAA